MGGPRRGVPASEFLAALNEAGGDIRKVDAVGLTNEQPVVKTRKSTAPATGIVLTKMDKTVVRAECRTDRTCVLLMTTRGHQVMLTHLLSEECERLVAQLQAASDHVRR